ncbi:hypothetical protein HK097_006290, partial [Rhizophlyctis rosea]
MATRPAGEENHIRGTNFTRQELEALTRRFTEIAPVLPHNTTSAAASAISTIAAASASGASPTSNQSVASQANAGPVMTGAGIGGGGAVSGGGG